MKRLALDQIDALLERVNEIAVDVDWSKYGLPFYPSKGGDVRPPRELRDAVQSWYAGLSGPSANTPKRNRRERIGAARGAR